MEVKPTRTLERGWALNAYREGIEAAKRKRPISANPYRAASDQALIWESGWKEGQELYNAQ